MLASASKVASGQRDGVCSRPAAKDRDPLSDTLTFVFILTFTSSRSSYLEQFAHTRLTLHHYRSNCGQLRPTTILSIVLPVATYHRAAPLCDAILRPTKPQSSPNIFSTAFGLSKEDGPAPLPSTSIADHLVHLEISRSSQTIPLSKSPSLSHDPLSSPPFLAPRSGVFLIGQQLCTSSSGGCKGTDHGDL